MGTVTSNPIPDHHKQWFEQLQLAFANGDVALMACVNAQTGEQRSVICIAQREEGGSIQFFPLGHLCPGNDPFDYYIPPATAHTEDGQEIGQTHKKTIN